MAKVAIMGFGTVGSGVYEIISSKNFEKPAGEDLEVKYILDIRDFDEPKGLLTKEFNDILNDEEVTIVAEVMGGLHPAYEFTKQLLESGKSVVTSNKELVATYGTELLEIAYKNDVQYLFEASVGGGIPIIAAMMNNLGANRIEKIAGILNGTTNYILTEMFTKGKDFEEVLKKAQELGYAERNPAADVEGHDACRKIAILSSLAWGKFVDYNDIHTEGITNITLEDVKYAEKMDSVIKLIGYADIDENDRVYARVSPMIIPNSYPIANVNDVFNAVTVSCDMLGEAMFYGRGAGKLPTASAVVSDIIECRKHKKMHNILWTDSGNGNIIPYEEKEVSYMVRVTGDCDAFEGYKAIEGIIDGEKAYIIPKITEKEFASLTDGLDSVVSKIRMYE